MDNKKPMTAEEVAKMRKNAKNGFIAAGIGLVIVILLTLAGGAPTWMNITVGALLAASAYQWWTAKKAEENLKNGGAAMIPPTEPKM